MHQERIDVGRIRREQVVEAAVAVITEEGLQNLSLSAIEKRAGTWVLVAFVDLDGFKQINDTYGHEVGDHFLQEIASRLRAALRVADIGARLGGDEFVVAGAGPDNAERVASAKRKFQERIFAATVGDYQLGDVQLAYRGASVGVIAVEPGALNADQAIREADAAMYVVKRSRKIGADVRIQ